MTKQEVKEEFEENLQDLIANLESCNIDFNTDYFQEYLCRFAVLLTYIEGEV